MAILRVNLSDRTYSYEEIPESLLHLGGRGLIAKVSLDEILPTCDPLGLENKLIVAPGLLTGTGIPSTGRLSIGGKSPLTGTIKESNVGGTVSQAMVSLGLKVVILEGKASSLMVLNIKKDAVEFIDGKEYQGMGNYEFTKVINQKSPSEISILSIGPAGEKLFLTASIAATNIEGIPSRHAGRGGMGTVMGSKNIKGITFEKGKNKVIEPTSPEEFKKSTKALAKALIAHPTTGKTLPKYGTSVIVNVTQNAGSLPTRNFSSGQFQGADLISGETLKNLLDSRGGRTGHACHRGCIIKCSNIYNDQEGNYLTSSLEYETLAMFGSNCDIDDLDTIAQLDRLCDDYGIDTIEMGAAMGVAMGAGVIPFGDGPGAINLIKGIVQDNPMGKILGQGCAHTGKALGIKRIPVVKNQSLAAYDPRSLKGAGVTYATTTMGADHTNGNGLGGDIDPLKPAGQIEYSRFFQRLSALFDTLGLCWFTRAPIIQDFTLLDNIMNALIGGDWTKDKLLEFGNAIIGYEREFNKRAGFLPEHDRLPEFFLTEKLPPHNVIFDVTKEELDEIHG